MARKNTSAAPRARTSKARKAAVVIATVASVVGYDPTLLLAAPLPEVITTSPVSSDYALIEGFLAQMAAEPATATAIDQAPAEEVQPEETLTALLAGIEPFEVGNAMIAVDSFFTERSRYEADKNPDNANIQKNLSRYRKALTSDHSLRVMLALEIDESFVDSARREGNRYNVYAIDKVADMVSYLAGNPSMNRINAAVVRSMIAFEAAGVEFTGAMAKAAASDKIRVEPRFKALLTSHTVSEGTAPTQASSTMQALQTLGIVTAEGSSRNPTYRLTETIATKTLRERIAA